MQPDLTTIQPETHRAVVAELLAELQQRPEIAGILLIGSLGRGNAIPGSDIDLLLLLDDGRSEERPVQHQERRDLWIELHQRDAAWAETQMLRDEEWIYAYLEGRILYDPQGEVARIITIARDHFASYRTPSESKARLRFLAERTLHKLDSALEAGDHDRAATIVGLGASGIVRLLWAAHERPIVGPTNIWFHVADLPGLSPAMHEQVRTLVLGKPTERVQSARAVCRWIIAYLGQPAAV
jgi:predicted nucleotidyltransferase